MSAQDTTIGQEIWDQIGMWTKAACGARLPVADDATLQFAVTIARGRTHKVVVTLNSSDLYDVELVRMGRSPDFAVITERRLTDVGAEALDQTIYGLCNT